MKSVTFSLYFALGLCLSVFALDATLLQAQSTIRQSEEQASSSIAGASSSLRDPAFAHLREGVVKITLSNGLRVLLFQRSVAPVFAGQLWVKVGGVDEKTGVTGVSHMLEHMAFKGTREIGTKDYAAEDKLLKELQKLMDSPLEKGASDEDSAAKSARVKEIYAELEKLWINNEYSRLYEARGAQDLNAGTSKDYTYYTVELPSVAFEFWCSMESERLLNPVFRQFYKEREVVLEERRMRVDDDPDGRLYEAMLATAFWQHNNRLPTIGWPSDVSHLSVHDLEDLYSTYYVPENMVLAVVGDIDPAAAKPLLEKYFGRIPPGKKPLPRIATVEEPQIGEREVQVLFDSNPRFMIAFHKPVFPASDDDAYFAVLHGILSGGRSSLLYRDLVLKRHLALAVETSEAPGERYPSVFFVSAVPRNGVGNEVLRDEIQKILDRLKTEKVSQSDLDAAKRQIKAGFVKGISSNNGLAETLAHAELLWGSWEEEFKLRDLIDKTSAEDIQRLAQTYFRHQGRTYAHLEKPVRKQ